MARLRRFAPHSILLSIVAAATLLSALVAFSAPIPNDDHHYNAAGYTVRHVWTNVADYVIGPFRGDMSRQRKDALIMRYLELNAMIRDGERIAGDATTDPEVAGDLRIRLDQWTRERERIENRVERIFEERLTEVIRDAGLTRRFGTDIVWPPVSIEFEQPPSVLVHSPRGEIRSNVQSLLRGDLPLEQIQHIESKAEQDGDTAALVVRIGGLAMYPAIIPPSSNYRFLLDDIAHEWMHHYLFFSPLGRRYAANSEMITLNETVANLVGKELGAMMLERYPMPNAKGYSGGARLASPAVPVDFTEEMRTLRRDVERLLDRGQVEQAEALMEERRQFLAVNGYYIRRLNQAYFGFHGSYADTGASIDPIGPKLEQLRELTGNLEEYVSLVQDFRSMRDLDRTIEYVLRR